MADSYLILFPAYALFSPTDQTPMVHVDGEVKHIALFTDLDAAKTFVERRGQPCIVAEIPDRHELRQFLSGFRVDDMVSMAPLDDTFRTHTEYTVGQILASL